MTYATESLKVSSQKSVLVTIKPSKRLQVWTVHSGSVYKKVVENYVVGVKEAGTALTEVASIAAISSASKYFFDAVNKTLYVRTSGSVDPSNVFLSATFIMTYANVPTIQPYDLSSGFSVEFDSRVSSIGKVSQEIDPQELFGISLEGNCSITLINSDGYFDDIYDTYVWENAYVSIYSWFPSTAITDAAVIFKGYIKSKSFSSVSVTFSAGDFVSQLNDNVKTGQFSASDGTLLDSFIGTPKPRIYGRVTGKKLISTDCILEGFTGTGTISLPLASSTVTGVGTAFLDELSPDDEIIITQTLDVYTYRIKSITSNTSLVVSEVSDIDISTSSFKIKPEKGWRKKNRDWFISGHKLREPVPTITSIDSQNRFTLSSTLDLFTDDLVDIDSTLYRIRRIFNNDVVLYSNVQTTLTVGETVRKSPINSLQFIGEKRTYTLVENRDFTVSNTSTKCSITLSDDAELNFINPSLISITCVFTNGSRDVTVSAGNALDFIAPRDFIKDDRISTSIYYEVLSVADDGLSLKLRVVYAGSNYTSTNTFIKSMDVINDESTVITDCYGMEYNSAWVKTASDAVKHMLEVDAQLQESLNTTSFQAADELGAYILSYSIPYNSTSFVKIRDAITDINKSIFGNLYNNFSYEICYSVLQPDKGSDLNVIENDDVFSFSVATKSDILKTIKSKYNHFEADSINGQTGSSFTSFNSDFVSYVTGLVKEREYDLYLYATSSAEMITQRLSLIYSLAQSIVKVSTDLRLATKSVNDKMWINLDRLYKRFGQASSQKIGIITSVGVDDNGCEVQFSDLGNAFNRVASIADNSTAVFTSATDREKMLAGFIVDSTKHLPDTSSDVEANTNLIG